MTRLVALSECLLNRLSPNKRGMLLMSFRAIRCFPSISHLLLVLLTVSQISLIILLNVTPFWILPAIIWQSVFGSVRCARALSCLQWHCQYVADAWPVALSTNAPIGQCKESLVLAFARTLAASVLLQE